MANEIVNESLQTTVEQDASIAEPEEARPDAADDLRITIRKLEMPVRPRGVLAE
jgi:hypothetical protein